ncbi:uncharacterized protein LOC134310697 [Trichomycterus rosablanca]|uniref:uncharacterized protein LOC134310697 n=1 Tax=Trichomycterus rosablanca TaxID=2290929 RepID=UPI002F34F716
MVSAEKTSIKKRKDKKRELCSPWEGPTANDGLDDERMLDVFQRAKQQVQLKCRFVDERNIVVSPHLLGKCFWTSEPHGNDEEEKSCSAQFHKPQDKSPSPVEEPEPPVAAPAEPSPLNQTNTKITTDYSTHKHNIIYSLSPAQTSPQELKPNLPLIRWAPPAARVVVMEEPVARRSKPFTTSRMVP